MLRDNAAYPPATRSPSKSYTPGLSHFEEMRIPGTPSRPRFIRRLAVFLAAGVAAAAVAACSGVPHRLAEADDLRTAIRSMPGVESASSATRTASNAEPL